MRYDVIALVNGRFSAVVAYDLTEEEARAFCEDNNWEWIDPIKPGFVYDLGIRRALD